jgi:hypothetical protein
VTTPADELRAAAEKLRSLAHAATPGPWRQHDTHLGQYGYTATVLSGEGNDTDLRAWLPSMSQEPWDETRNAWPDAAYIAAMHPGVGRALADLLDDQADGDDEGEINPWALAVARQINGTAS